MFNNLTEVWAFEKWFADGRILVRFSPSYLGPYSDEYVLGQLKWVNRNVADVSDLRERLDEWREEREDVVRS